MTVLNNINNLANICKLMLRDKIHNKETINQINLNKVSALKST